MAAAGAVTEIVKSHNRILEAAHSRIDGHLEERLAEIIQPILDQAGSRAAARFARLATNHLTASLLRDADQRALARLPPGVADDGFFGYRLRPIVLTATAPTPDSAMICVKPRPDEAAALAFEGGEPAESLHVTLCYLGPLPGSLQDIADALAPVAASHAPLVGVVGGVGKFEPPGVAILLPDVPGLVELRVAITEALAAADVFYARNHGFEAHISIDAEPDPETLEEALRRSAQKPLHFDSILLVRGDEVAVELPLVGPPPVTAALTAAGDPTWTGPAGDELVDVDALVKTLRTKTDPVRNALLKATMDPALEKAGLSFDVTNPLTAKILAQSGSQIKGIAQTTQLNVMRIVGRAYNEGLSIPDTAKAIRAGMASASNYRARLIARCLPGETPIDAGVVRAVTRRWYEGDFVIVRTESGREFSATPNHPMLTRRGWARLGELDERDHLICRSGQQDTRSACDEDIGDPPATIAEVFEAAATVGIVERRTGGEPDFHGDGIDGEVDIARPFRPLTVGHMTTLYEHLREEIFAPSDEGPGATFCSECGHILSVDQTRCLCGIPSPDSSLGKDAARDSVGDAEAASEGLYRFSGVEGGDDSVFADVFAEVRSATATIEEVPPRAAEGSRFDASGSEAVTDRGFVDPKEFADLPCAQAAEIETDRIVSTRRTWFGGWVYNLVTPNGYFIANGGYTGNTELAGAANGGSLAATQLVAETIGVGFFKQWLTAEGAPHPRHEDYEGLNEQTVALDEPFDVGGEPLQFPGDPAGDPSEVCNCRCALAYTETPPEGTDTGAAGGGIDEQGASTEGTSALEDVMPLTPPPGDTVSVAGWAPVPAPVVARIKEFGLDKPLGDVRPTTTLGRETYPDGVKDTRDLFKPGGEWTAERQQLHADIVARHFEGKTPPLPGEKKTAVFTSGGGASGKGGTMIDIGDRSFPLSELEEHPERFPDVILMNPDIVKEMIPEYQTLRDVNDLFAASGVYEESSEIGKVVAAKALRDGYNVVFDTTGSSSTFVRKLEEAMREGYDTKVRMVSIPTNEAIVRAMDRGDKRGRYVAIQALKGAHRGASAQAAIWKDVQGLDWKIYDNTDARVLVAEKKAGETTFTVHDQAKFDQILAKANEGSHAPGAAIGKVARPSEAAVPPAPAAPLGPSVATLVPGPSTAVQAAVRLKYDTMLAHWKSWAKAVGADYDAVLQDARENLVARVKDAPVQVRVRPDTLQSILADGRFKSQFETNTSAGALNPDARARAERNMFGYKLSLPAEQRPIYGYLGGSSSEVSGPVTQYGMIAVRLKNDVRARTTFTMTDSLTPAQEKTIAAVPVERPSLEAFGSGSYSPTEARPPTYSGTLREISDFYAEAQIHGGLTVDDIAQVFLDRQGMAEELGYLERTLKTYEANLARLERQDPAGEYTARTRANVQAFKDRIAMIENDGARIVALLDQAGIANKVVDFSKKF